MIFIDSSALIAILEKEPEQPEFFRAVSQPGRRLLSAVNYQETAQVVFARRGAFGVQQLEDLLEDISAEIIAHDEELSRLAVGAFRRFGKGIHAKARLNLGDCAAYALSRKLRAPLLFKGDDFAATDVRSYVPPPAT